MKSRFFVNTLRTLANLRVLDRRELGSAWKDLHLRRVLRHLRVDCVFDIGANFGQHAEMLRRIGFKGLTVSFEPIPAAVQALRKKAGNDRFWKIEDLAISSSNGFQTFNVMANSEFSSLSEPHQLETKHFARANSVKDQITVRTETLDTAYRRLVKQHGFSRPFLKLDTQGFDVAIVQSSLGVIHNFVGLQSELSVKKLYHSSVDFREALAIYEQAGFELNGFMPNNRGHFPRVFEIDCVMVRKDLLG